MLNDRERNANVARLLRPEFPAKDKGKRIEAAKAIGRTPTSFERKLSGSPVEVRATTAAEIAALAENNLVGASFFNKLLAPARMKTMPITSDTPLSKVLTVLTRISAAGAEALEDLKLTQDEKAMLAPLIDRAENGLNALRLACAEEGVTRL